MQNAIRTAAVLVFAAAAALYFCREDVGFLTRFAGEDIETRWNESVLMHRGIDPFDVWAHKVEVPGFQGLIRPDMEEEARGVPMVHAYAPWHNALTWFYGWMDRDVLKSLFFGLYSAILFCMVVKFHLVARRDTDHPLLATAFFAVLLLLPGTNNFHSMNYGLLLAVALWAMIRMLKREREFLVALCLVVMMFKPQIGLLFCWPLVVMRKVRPIVIAAAICLALTCVPACALGKSPLELILQIPQLGVPYATVFHAALLQMLIKQLFGSHALVLWAIAMFAACGAWTWSLRKKGDVLILFLPAAAIFPIWTYSRIYDAVVAWPIMLLVSLALFRRNGYAPLQKFTFAMCAFPAVLISFVCGVFARKALAIASSATGHDFSGAVGVLMCILENRPYVFLFGSAMLLLSAVWLSMDSRRTPSDS